MIKKTILLEFFMIKDYIRTLLLTLLVPIILAYLNKSITLSTCIYSIVVSYRLVSIPFELCEPTADLYSILPVSKRNLVLGRYIYLMLLGTILISISIFCEAVVLYFAGISQSISLIVFAFIIGFVLFGFMASIQIPFIYKCGIIKAKTTVSSIAIIIGVALIGILTKMDIDMYNVFTIATLLVICFVFFLLSFMLSLYFYQAEN